LEQTTKKKALKEPVKKEWGDWYNKDKVGKAITDDDSPREEQKHLQSLPVPVIEIPKLYEPRMWKGIVPTFRCVVCGHCDPDEDAMKLHVIRHVPEDQKNSTLERLIRGK